MPLLKERAALRWSSDAAQPWSAVVLALATGLGLGFAPVVPATFGSLLGPPLAYAIQCLPGMTPLGQVVAALVLLAIGVPICRHAQRHFDRKDPGPIVFDEIAACVLVFAFVPVTLVSGFLGFFWFRVFDILKPWPGRRLERLPDGLGIMADDYAAAVYAQAALHLTLRMWPS